VQQNVSFFNIYRNYNNWIQLNSYLFAFQLNSPKQHTQTKYKTEIITAMMIM
jgi:hypothetical protein